MKMLWHCALTLTFCSLAAAQDFGRWQVLPAIDSSEYALVSATSGDGSNIYAGTTKGKIYVTSNDGQSWGPISAGLPSGFIGGIFSEGSFLLASVSPDRVYRSINGGQSWQKVPTAPPGGDRAEFAAFNGCVYYAGAPTAHRTCNRGETWETVVVDPRGVNTFAPVSISRFGSALVIGSGADIYISDGNGANWQRRALPDPLSRVVAITSVGPELFVGSYLFDVLRSSDSGLTWKSVGPEKPVIYQLLTLGNTLIVTGDTGVYASADLGGTWVPISTGLPVKEAGVLVVKGSSLFLPFSTSDVFRNDGPLPNAAILSAASFRSGQAAPNSIVALFGSGLASGTSSASAAPLPTTLGDTTVRLKDAAGVTHQAPLFFVSPGQVNFQVPAVAAIGKAVVAARLNGEGVGICEVEVSGVAPGIFTANSDGAGPPAGLVLRATGAGQTYEPTAAFDTASGKFLPAAIDFGPAGDQLSLILFGTGIRNRFSLGQVIATAGGVSLQVTYAGPVSGFVGLDQVNLLLPRTLIGKGEVSVALIVEGREANEVRVRFK